MSKKKAAPNGGYDDENAKKGPVLRVEFAHGGSRLFPEDHSWRFRKIARDDWLEVRDSEGKIVAQIKQHAVLAVSRGAFIFRDAEWK